MSTWEVITAQGNCARYQDEEWKGQIGQNGLLLKRKPVSTRGDVVFYPHHSVVSIRFLRDN